MEYLLLNLLNAIGKLCRYWMWLGAIAFTAMIAVYGLMVFKPVMPEAAAAFRQ